MKGSSSSYSLVFHVFEIVLEIPTSSHSLFLMILYSGLSKDPGPASPERPSTFLNVRLTVPFGNPLKLVSFL